MLTTDDDADDGLVYRGKVIPATVKAPLSRSRIERVEDGRSEVSSMSDRLPAIWLAVMNCLPVTEGGHAGW